MLKPRQFYYVFAGLYTATSGIVAASQKAFAQEQFAQATASGSRNAFIVLLIMSLIAFALCCLMTVNRKRGK